MSQPANKSRETKIQVPSLAAEFNNDLFMSLRREFKAGAWPQNYQRCEDMVPKQPGHSKQTSEELFLLNSLEGLSSARKLDWRQSLAELSKALS